MSTETEGNQPCSNRKLIEQIGRMHADKSRKGEESSMSLIKKGLLAYCQQPLSLNNPST
jgi:hypothetical protein